MGETRFLDFAEGRLAYDDSGTAGPLVVAVPGIGDLRSSYRFLAPQLVAAGYRVVTVDLPGHGESSAGDWGDYSPAALGARLLALVRSLGAGPAVLVGNSFAGGAVAWAAAEPPELVAGVVLLDAFARDIPMSPLMAFAFRLMVSGPWRVAAWSAYYRSLFKARRPVDLGEHLARLTANLREPGRFDSLVRMTRTSQVAAEAALARVRAPALVIMGGKDPDFRDPAAEAQLLASRLRGRAVVIPGAGHYPHAELPQETGAVILDFLRGEVRRA